MKQRKIQVLASLMALTLFLVASCSKDANVVNTQDSNNPTYEPQPMTAGGGGSTYHSYQCPADQGNGCYCAISPLDQDCELQTECTSNGLTNYTRVLNEKYTEAEIEQMETDNAPITDPDLKQALYDDGFPIILE